MYDYGVQDKNPHAVALGRLGGKALARKMTPKQRQAWARLGGLTRSRKYSKEQLSRWAKLGGRPAKGTKGGKK